MGVKGGGGEGIREYCRDATFPTFFLLISYFLVISHVTAHAVSTL